MLKNISLLNLNPRHLLIGMKLKSY